MLMLISSVYVTRLLRGFLASRFVHLVVPCAKNLPDLLAWKLVAPFLCRPLIRATTYVWLTSHNITSSRITGSDRVVRDPGSCISASLVHVSVREVFFGFSSCNAALLATFSKDKCLGGLFQAGVHAGTRRHLCYELNKATTSSAYGETSSTRRSSSARQFSSCPRRACREERMNVIFIKTRLWGPDGGLRGSRETSRHF